MYSDLHAHLLPAVDDGPQTVEQAVRLAQAALLNGITQLAVTPHFYAWEHDFSERILKRQQQFACLQQQLEVEKCSFEHMVTGFEVAYFDAIAHCEQLELLTLGRSNYLLLELSGGPIDHIVINRLRELNDRGFSIILAHAERYIKCRGFSQLLPLVREGEIICQVNAASFFLRGARRAARSLLREGYVQLLASDMHNTELRPPKLHEALQWVRAHSGSKTYYKLITQANEIFEKCL